MHGLTAWYFLFWKRKSQIQLLAEGIFGFKSREPFSHLRTHAPLLSVTLLDNEEEQPAISNLPKPITELTLPELSLHTETNAQSLPPGCSS